MSLWVTAVQSNEKKIAEELNSVEMGVPSKTRDNLSNDRTKQDCVLFAVLY